MEPLANEIARMIAMSEERQELVTLEDGFVYFWPDGSPHGALSPWASHHRWRFPVNDNAP
jgi:hypothetical protein